MDGICRNPLKPFRPRLHTNINVSLVTILDLDHLQAIHDLPCTIKRCNSLSYRGLEGDIVGETSGLSILTSRVGHSRRRNLSGWKRREWTTKGDFVCGVLGSFGFRNLFLSPFSLPRTLSSKVDDEVASCLFDSKQDRSLRLPGRTLKIIR